MFDCPIVMIMNLSRDGSITTFLNMAVAILFSLVLASSCHIFIIALQKLKANSVAPTAAQNSKYFAQSSLYWLVSCSFCSFSYSGVYCQILHFQALQIAYYDSNTLFLCISHTHFGNGVLLIFWAWSLNSNSKKWKKERGRIEPGSHQTMAPYLIPSIILHCMKTSKTSVK